MLSVRQSSLRVQIKYIGPPKKNLDYSWQNPRTQFKMKHKKGMTDVSRLVSREPACEGLHYVRGKFCRISERHTNTGKSSKFGQKPFFFFKKKHSLISKS